MIVEKSDGRWMAHGKGPLRYIIGEGACRKEAMRFFVELWEMQWGELWVK